MSTKRNRDSLVVVEAIATISSALGVFSPADGIASNDVGAMDLQGVSRREWAASIRWENDTFGGTDQFYTDGIALAVSHTGSSWMDPFANWLPWGEGLRTVGYVISQEMFTPTHTGLNHPNPDDRPYAGILTIGLTLHVEKENAYHGLKFVTGVVGPWSLAEEKQDAVHDLIGNDKSQGWDYQTENEPILNISYEYRHKFDLAGDRAKWSLQAIPFAGGWMGNMLIQGQAGGLLRFGFNMQDDFGPTLVRGMGHMPPPRRDTQRRSNSDWGFFICAGSAANLVFRDITLDGNTFEDSPSVNKKFYVPTASVGVGVGNQRFLASFAYVFWGREFDGQQSYSRFGSISVSHFF